MFIPGSTSSASRLAPVLRLLRGLFGVAASLVAVDSRANTLPPARHPGAGQIYYFLLVDRFENGSSANDTGGIPGGRDQHGFDPTQLGYFHGGDLAGLEARLDYLTRLGITQIWIAPPLANKPVQGASAGYHGYWITDFLRIDPHLGSDDEFRAFVGQAHARGLRVCMDIVLNHTADVIQFQGGNYAYRPRSTHPYRDAAGQPFDEQAVAFNGLNDPAAFPALAVPASFPYVPVVPPAEATAKNPAWLNDVTLYHNRGNTTFTGEDSVHGDFFGLDDLFTEHPRVVDGLTAIYAHWLTEYDIDGFRIDTVRHANTELWQAFAPAVRAAARADARPHFLHFGEVSSGDAAFLSQFTTAATLDAVLDFGFAYRARDFASRRQPASRLTSLFDQDDLYTDHDSDAYAGVLFLGNHDMGRFAWFLRQDNPAASDAELVDRMELAHALMFCVRGSPVVYYGDEQGMVGTGGDTRAREDMFATQVPEFAGLGRLGTSARGDVAKFDEDHPIYRTLRALAGLRAGHAALRDGAMLVRTTTSDSVFACSRLRRDELVEYLFAGNNAGGAATVLVPTSQPPGAVLRRIFDSRTPDAPGAATLTVDSGGRVTVPLEARQSGVWRADAPLPAPALPPSIAISWPLPGTQHVFGAETTDGLTFPTRLPVRAEVAGAADFAEVTFGLVRADRPGQVEILGVDDAPPFRIHWRPPADLPAGTEFTFTATVDDRRGGWATAAVGGLRHALAPGVTSGIAGSTTPVITGRPAAASATEGDTVAFTAAATGTAPLEFQWMKDGEPLPCATDPVLKLRHVGAADAGGYAVRVRNLAGTALAAPAALAVHPRTSPVITAHPAPATVAPGGSASFSVAAAAPEPPAYQWTKDGVALPGAVSAVLSLDNLATADAGDYAVIVTAGTGSVTSAAARLLVATPVAGRLANLSVRSLAGGGDRTLVAGFVLGGTGGAPVLVRGIGPALAPFGVDGWLPDPALALYRAGTDAPVATNDDWSGDPGLVAAFARAGAFGLPVDSADAALLATLSAGAYTAHVGGGDASPGVALAELYEDPPGGAATLVNLSSRSLVGAGDETLVVGFVFGGNVPKRLLVRGVGPALRDFGVGGALGDPVLTLYRRGQPAPLAGNDDWDGDPALAAAFVEAGAFALASDSLDSAFAIVVVPGEYTAHVSGFAGAAGVGLVEVYELP